MMTSPGQMVQRMQRKRLERLIVLEKRETTLMRYALNDCSATSVMSDTHGGMLMRIRHRRWKLSADKKTKRKHLSTESIAHLSVTQTKHRVLAKLGNRSQMQCRKMIRYDSRVTFCNSWPSKLVNGTGCAITGECKGKSNVHKSTGDPPSFRNGLLLMTSEYQRKIWYRRFRLNPIAKDGRV